MISVLSCYFIPLIFFLLCHLYMLLQTIRNDHLIIRIGKYNSGNLTQNSTLQLQIHSLLVSKAKLKESYQFMSYTYLCKYIIIGDSGIGKSCLLMRYANNQYREKHEVTIGVQYGTRLLNLYENIIKLQIWDTAGQECYRSIIRGYYRNSIGTILCYDTTCRQTFTSIQKWVQQVKQTSPSNMQIILVGTKSDRNNERKVLTEEAQKFANQNGMLFIQCSAKTNKNVDKIFENLTQKILQMMQKNKIQMKNQAGIKIGNMPHLKNQVEDKIAQQKLDYHTLKKKNYSRFSSSMNIWSTCLSFLSFR